MANEEKEEDIRAKFYTSPSTIKCISANRVPKSKHAFMDMVSSYTLEKLDNKKREELIVCLTHVVFSKNPPQTNILDKSKRKTITSTRRQANDDSSYRCISTTRVADYIDAAARRM